MLQKFLIFLKKLFGLSPKTPKVVVVNNPTSTPTKLVEYYYVVKHCENGHEEKVISLVKMNIGQSFFFSYNRDNSGCYEVISETSEAERILPRNLRVFDGCDKCNQ